MVSLTINIRVGQRNKHKNSISDTCSNREGGSSQLPNRNRNRSRSQLPNRNRNRSRSQNLTEPNRTEHNYTKTEPNRTESNQTNVTHLLRRLPCPRTPRWASMGSDLGGSTHPKKAFKLLWKQHARFLFFFKEQKRHLKNCR